MNLARRLPFATLALSFVLSRDGQEAVAAADGWRPLPPAVATAERQKLS